MMNDEIVKGLRTCTAVNGSCEVCPYDDPDDALCECANRVSNDAADAIENILAENAALRRQIDNLTSAQAVMVKEFEEKLEELAQVKAERDAALRMMWEGVGADDLPEPLNEAPTGEISTPPNEHVEPEWKRRVMRTFLGGR